MCIEKIVHDPGFLSRYSIADLIRESGAQGVELLTWVAMRGALIAEVLPIHNSYHVPISNTVPLSWCSRAKLTRGGWLEPVAGQRPKHFAGQRPPGVIKELEQGGGDKL